MSLEGAKFICLDEAGNHGEMVLAKGRKFTVGCYVSCDFVLADERAKGVHCEIECDAFGRVTIRNLSADKPILVNGSAVEIKRNLLNNSKLSILDKEYLWLFPKSSSNEFEDLPTEDASTPQKLIGIPEQPPNSCPDFKLHRELPKRFTVHNFAYCIQSDEEGNISSESNDESTSEDTNQRNNKQNELETQKEENNAVTINEETNKNQEENNAITKVEEETSKRRSITPDPKDGKDSSAPTTKSLMETPKMNLINCTKDKENKSTQKKNKHLLTMCHQSDVVITSFSPRETGVKIEKSFATIIKPKVLVTKTPATPKSVYSTPKSELNDSKELQHQDDEDDERELMTFHTPSTSKKGAVKVLKNSSMHLIDLTTPNKLRPASPYLKSALKASAKKNIDNKSNTSTKLSTEEQLGLTALPSTPALSEASNSPLETPSSVISVSSSTDTSSVIEVTSDGSNMGITPSSASGLTTPVKPQTRAGACTPKRTPQSLMKRALLTSAKKQNAPTTPHRNINTATANTTPRRESINRIPLRSNLALLRTPVTPQASTGDKSNSQLPRRHSMSTPTRKSISARSRFDSPSTSSSVLATASPSTSSTRLASRRSSLNPIAAARALPTSTPVSGGGALKTRASCNTSPLHKVRKSIGGMPLSSHISKARRSIVLPASASKITSIKEKSPQQVMSNRLVSRARKSLCITPISARSRNMVTAAKTPPQAPSSILKDKTAQSARKPERKAVLFADKQVVNSGEVDDLSRTFIIDSDEEENQVNDKKEGKSTDATFSPEKNVKETKEESEKLENKEEIKSKDATFSPEKESEKLEEKISQSSCIEIPIDVEEISDSIKDDLQSEGNVNVKKNSDTVKEKQPEINKKESIVMEESFAEIINSSQEFETEENKLTKTIGILNSLKQTSQIECQENFAESVEEVEEQTEEKKIQTKEEKSIEVQDNEEKSHILEAGFGEESIVEIIETSNSENVSNNQLVNGENNQESAIKETINESTAQMETLEDIPVMEISNKEVNVPQAEDVANKAEIQESKVVYKPIVEDITLEGSLIEKETNTSKQPLYEDITMEGSLIEDKVKNEDIKEEKETETKKPETAQSSEQLNEKGSTEVKVAEIKAPLEISQTLEEQKLNVAKDKTYECSEDQNVQNVSSVIEETKSSIIEVHNTQIEETESSTLEKSETETSECSQIQNIHISNPAIKEAESSSYDNSTSLECEELEKMKTVEEVEVAKVLQTSEIEIEEATKSAVRETLEIPVCSNEQNKEISEVIEVENVEESKSTETEVGEDYKENELETSATALNDDLENTNKLLEEIEDVLNKSDEIKQKHLNELEEANEESDKPLTEEFESQKLSQEYIIDNKKSNVHKVIEQETEENKCQVDNVPVEHNKEAKLITEQDKISAESLNLVEGTTKNSSESVEQDSETTAEEYMEKKETQLIEAVEIETKEVIEQNKDNSENIVSSSEEPTSVEKSNETEEIVESQDKENVDSSKTIVSEEETLIKKKEEKESVNIPLTEIEIAVENEKNTDIIKQQDTESLTEIVEGSKDDNKEKTVESREKTEGSNSNNINDEVIIQETKSDKSKQNEDQKETEKDSEQKENASYDENSLKTKDSTSHEEVETSTETSSTVKKNIDTVTSSFTPRRSTRRASQSAETSQAAAEPTFTPRRSARRASMSTETTSTFTPTKRTTRRASLSVVNETPLTPKPITKRRTSISLDEETPQPSTSKTPRAKTPRKQLEQRMIIPEEMNEVVRSTIIEEEEEPFKEFDGNEVKKTRRSSIANATTETLKTEQPQKKLEEIKDDNNADIENETEVVNERKKMEHEQNEERNVENKLEIESTAESTEHQTEPTKVQKSIAEECTSKNEETKTEITEEFTISERIEVAENIEQNSANRTEDITSTEEDVKSSETFDQNSAVKDQESANEPDTYNDTSPKLADENSEELKETPIVEDQINKVSSKVSKSVKGEGNVEAIEETKQYKEIPDSTERLRSPKDSIENEEDEMEKLAVESEITTPKAKRLVTIVADSPRTPLMSGMRELLKTPKTEAQTPRLGGIRDLVRSPKETLENEEEENEKLAVVADLVKTPKAKIDSNAEFDSISTAKKQVTIQANSPKTPQMKGIRELLKTPKAETQTPRLAGIRDLVRSPKEIEENDEEEVEKLAHVAELVKTPIAKKESINVANSPQTPLMTGVRDLLKTPKCEMSTPQLVGIRNLVQTPKTKIENEQEESEKLAVVAELVKTPQHNQELDNVNEDLPSRSLENDNLRGVKELLKTPKSCGTPRFKGMRELMQTPKMSSTPLMGGVKELLESPVQTENNEVTVQQVSVEEIPSTSSKNNEHLKGIKELIRTPKSCSTPRLKGLRELMQTPKMSSTPVMGGLKELMDSSAAGQQNPEELDKYLRTPTAKNIMIPTMPSSAIIEKSSDSIEVSTEYDLNATHEGETANLEELFKTPVASRFVERITASYYGEEGEEHDETVEKFNRNETLQDTLNKSAEEAFDKLVGQESQIQTPIRKIYPRKSFPSQAPSPFTAAEVLSDLPKTDVEEWIETLENAEPPTILEDDEENVTDIGEESKVIEDDLANENLKVDEESEVEEVSISDETKQNITSNDDSIIPETCAKVYLTEKSITITASNSLPPTSTKDPLLDTNIKKIKEKESRPATPIDAEISGINLLDQTIDSVQEETSMLDEPLQVEEPSMFEEPLIVSDNESEANNTLNEAVAVDDTNDLSEPLLVSDSEDLNQSQESDKNDVIEIKQVDEADLRDQEKSMLDKTSNVSLTEDPLEATIKEADSSVVIVEKVSAKFEESIEVKQNSDISNKHSPNSEKNNDISATEVSEESEFIINAVETDILEGETLQIEDSPAKEILKTDNDNNKSPTSQSPKTLETHEILESEVEVAETLTIEEQEPIAMENKEEHIPISTKEISIKETKVLSADSENIFMDSSVSEICEETSVTNEEEQQQQRPKSNKEMEPDTESQPVAKETSPQIDECEDIFMDNSNIDESFADEANNGENDVENESAMVEVSTKEVVNKSISKENETTAEGLIEELKEETSKLETNIEVNEENEVNKEESDETLTKPNEKETDMSISQEKANDQQNIEESEPPKNISECEMIKPNEIEKEVAEVPQILEKGIETCIIEEESSSTIQEQTAPEKPSETPSSTESEQAKPDKIVEQELEISLKVPENIEKSISKLTETSSIIRQTSSIEKVSMSKEYLNETSSCLDKQNENKTNIKKSETPEELIIQDATIATLDKQEDDVTESSNLVEEKESSAEVMTIETEVSDVKEVNEPIQPIETTKKEQEELIQPKSPKQVNETESVIDNESKEIGNVSTSEIIGTKSSESKEVPSSSASEEFNLGVTESENNTEIESFMENVSPREPDSKTEHIPTIDENNQIENDLASEDKRIQSIDSVKLSNTPSTSVEKLLEKVNESEESKSLTENVAQEEPSTKAEVSKDTEDKCTKDFEVTELSEEIKVASTTFEETKTTDKLVTQEIIVPTEIVKSYDFEVKINDISHNKETDIAIKTNDQTVKENAPESQEEGQFEAVVEEFKTRSTRRKPTISESSQESTQGDDRSSRSRRDRRKVITKQSEDKLEQVQEEVTEIQLIPKDLNTKRKRTASESSHGSVNDDDNSSTIRRTRRKVQKAPIEETVVEEKEEISQASLPEEVTLSAVVTETIEKQHTPVPDDIVVVQNEEIPQISIEMEKEIVVEKVLKEDIQVLDEEQKDMTAIEIVDEKEKDIVSVQGGIDKINVQKIETISSEEKQDTLPIPQNNENENSEIAEPHGIKHSRRKSTVSESSQSSIPVETSPKTSDFHLPKEDSEIKSKLSNIIEEPETEVKEIQDDLNKISSNEPKDETAVTELKISSISAENVSRSETSELPKDEMDVVEIETTQENSIEPPITDKLTVQSTAETKQNLSDIAEVPESDTMETEETELKAFEEHKAKSHKVDIETIKSTVQEVDNNDSEETKEQPLRRGRRKPTVSESSQGSVHDEEYTTRGRKTRRKVQKTPAEEVLVEEECDVKEQQEIALTSAKTNQEIIIVEEDHVVVVQDQIEGETKAFVLEQNESTAAHEEDVKTAKVETDVVDEIKEEPVKRSRRKPTVSESSQGSVHEDNTSDNRRNRRKVQKTPSEDVVVEEVEEKEPQLQLEEGTTAEEHIENKNEVSELQSQIGECEEEKTEPIIRVFETEHDETSETKSSIEEQEPKIAKETQEVFKETPDEMEETKDIGVKRSRRKRNASQTIIEEPTTSRRGRHKVQISVEEVTPVESLHIPETKTTKAEDLTIEEVKSEAESKQVSEHKITRTEEKTTDQLVEEVSVVKKAEEQENQGRLNANKEDEVLIETTENETEIIPIVEDVSEPNEKQKEQVTDVQESSQKVEEQQRGEDESKDETVEAISTEEQRKHVANVEEPHEVEVSLKTHPKRGGRRKAIKEEIPADTTASLEDVTHTTRRGGRHKAHVIETAPTEVPKVRSTSRNRKRPNEQPAPSNDHESAIVNQNKLEKIEEVPMHQPEHIESKNDIPINVPTDVVKAPIDVIVLEDSSDEEEKMPYVDEHLKDEDKPIKKSTKRTASETNVVDENRIKRRARHHGEDIEVMQEETKEIIKLHNVNLTEKHEEVDEKSQKSSRRRAATSKREEQEDHMNVPTKTRRRGPKHDDSEELHYVEKEHLNEPQTLIEDNKLSEVKVTEVNLELEHNKVSEVKVKEIHVESEHIEKDIPAETTHRKGRRKAAVEEDHEVLPSTTKRTVVTQHEEHDHEESSAVGKRRVGRRKHVAEEHHNEDDMETQEETTKKRRHVGRRKQGEEDEKQHNEEHDESPKVHDESPNEKHADEDENKPIENEEISGKRRNIRKKNSVEEEHHNAEEQHDTEHQHVESTETTHKRRVAGRKKHAIEHEHDQVTMANIISVDIENQTEQQPAEEIKKGKGRRKKINDHPVEIETEQPTTSHSPETKQIEQPTTSHSPETKQRGRRRKESHTDSHNHIPAEKDHYNKLTTESETILDNVSTHSEIPQRATQAPATKRALKAAAIEHITADSRETSEDTPGRRARNVPQRKAATAYHNYDETSDTEVKTKPAKKKTDSPRKSLEVSKTPSTAAITTAPIINTSPSPSSTTSTTTARGRTRKPTAKVQQFLEEERAKAETPKKRGLLAASAAIEHATTPQRTPARRGRKASTIDTDNIEGTPQASKGRGRGRHVAKEEQQVETVTVATVAVVEEEKTLDLQATTPPAQPAKGRRGGRKAKIVEEEHQKIDEPPAKKSPLELENEKQESSPLVEGPTPTRIAGRRNAAAAAKARIEEDALAAAAIDPPKRPRAKKTTTTKVSTPVVTIAETEQRSAEIEEEKLVKQKTSPLKRIHRLGSMTTIEGAAEDSEDHNETEAPKRARKAITSATNIATTTDSPAVPAKRGRKAKNVEVAETDTPAAEEPKTNRGRGRGRKNVNEDNEVVTATTSSHQNTTPDIETNTPVETLEAPLKRGTRTRRK